MADNAAAFRSLHAKSQIFSQIADEGLPDSAMEEITSAIREEQMRTIASGTDAYGVPWQKKQDPSDPAFRFVGHADVGVASSGKLVVVRLLTKAGVLHHQGNAKGKIKRPVIPVGAIPPRWQMRIKEIAERTIRDLVEGS